MNEVQGDIFSAPADVYGLVCIPTNGETNTLGSAVMGAGLALAARNRFPGVEVVLGSLLRSGGNHVHLLTTAQFAASGVVYHVTGCKTPLMPWHLCSFPTKGNWRHKSDAWLIRRSCSELVALVASLDLLYSSRTFRVALPRVGCGLGGLSWTSVVQPILSTCLPSACYDVFHPEAKG